MDAGVRGGGGLVLTLSFVVSDRFREAADEWGDERLMETEEAIESKAEQALLEIEHLVSGDVDPDLDFEVDEDRVRYDPSEELSAFLDEQAESAGVDPETVLKLHVDLFARVFLDDDNQRPPDAAPDGLGGA